MAKKNSRPKPRKSRSYTKKIKKSGKRNIPLLGTAIEAGGILLGASTALNGNVLDGLLEAAGGVVVGAVVDKIGKKTGLGKMKMSVSRKHTVSVI